MLYEAIRLGCDLNHKNECSYNDAYGGFLRENATTILPRWRALQGVGLSSMRFHPIGGGLKTMKTDKKHDSWRESHPLSDRPEIDWPCTT